MRRLNSIAVLAVLSGLVVLNTWPQAIRPRAVNDLGDPLLNAWALAWVAHELPTHPSRLFDGNIFYPERDTLAYSETLIVPALLVAPYLWAGGDPVIAHNVLLLVGCVLSGFAMFVFLRSLVNHDGAALVAGVLFALLPYRMEEYGHLQLQLTFLLPLILFQGHRLIASPSTGRGVGLGVLIGLQAYTCVYYVAYGAVLLTVVMAADVAMTGGVTWRRLATVVLTFGLTVVMLTMPLAIAYRSAADVVGERTISDLQAYSGDAREYVRPTSQSLLYGKEAEPWNTRRGIFPGVASLVLASVALVPPFTPLSVAYGLGCAVAIELSRGTNGGAYELLYHWLTPFRALRAPERFSLLACLAFSVLVGAGVARICAGRTPRVQAFVVIVATVLVSLETANRALELSEPPERAPSVYTWLATQPPGVVCEYPVGDVEGRIGPQDPTYMYYSTLHWMPLVNGYSGFEPSSYRDLKTALAHFPDNTALQYLRSRHVAILLLHQAFYLRGNFANDVAWLRHQPDVKLLGTFRWRDGQTTAAFRLAP